MNEKHVCMYDWRDRDERWCMIEIYANLRPLYRSLNICWAEKIIISKRTKIMMARKLGNMKHGRQGRSELVHLDMDILLEAIINLTRWELRNCLKWIRYGSYILPWSLMWKKFFLPLLHKFFRLVRTFMCSFLTIFISSYWTKFPIFTPILCSDLSLSSSWIIGQHRRQEIQKF